MKKLLLICCSFFLAFQLFGQQTITLPKLGDTNEIYRLKSAAAGGIDISASGFGVVWDLSDIDPDSLLPGIILNYFIDLEDAPFNDLYETADYVLVVEEDDIKEFTFLARENDRLVVLGTYDEGEMVPAVFPEPVLLSLLPVNFMDQETQTTPFVVEFFDEPDTLEVTLSFVANGYGTLLLPNGLVIEDALKFSNSTSFNTIFDVEDEDLGNIRVRVVGSFGTTQILSNAYGVPVLTRTSQAIDLFIVVIENIVEIPIQSFEFPSVADFIWDEGTAVNNRLFDGEIMVWPNPVQNNLYLSTLAQYASESVDVLLFDASGKMVLKKVSNGLGDGLQIKMSHLNPGFYQLLIHSNGRYFTERIIKQ